MRCFARIVPTHATLSGESFSLAFSRFATLLPVLLVCAFDDRSATHNLSWQLTSAAIAFCLHGELPRLEKNTCAYSEPLFCSQRATVSRWGNSELLIALRVLAGD